ncbi:N-alpha-acetyltransferase 40-like [Anopheles moucheti]|uniref:N-alpha-acetyltransferase 40-like n=1 Tax=Anopheles moucheti TaxID=186751 RepID=UPI0022F0A31F|nr:N-alpha-acetyltransferase 40-like [Anopheles moucheti]
MVEYMVPSGISGKKYAKFQKDYINLAAKHPNLNNAIPECRVFRCVENQRHVEFNIMCKRRQDLETSFMEWAYDLAERNLKQKYLAFGFRWQKNTSYKDLFLQWARYLIAYEPSTFLPIGYVFFRFNIAMGHTAITIHGLHVDKNYQNLGLGSYLMKTLEVLAHRLGVELLIIGAAKRDIALKRFLYRLGFTEEKKEASVNSEYEVLVAPTLCYEIMKKHQKSLLLQ